MYFSDDFIEEVRSNNDIVDVVSSYVKLKKNGSNYFGVCPFHNEKTASMSVNPRKQMFYCFGCHAGGSVFNFVQRYENFDFKEALTYLAERAHIPVPQDERSKRDKESEDLKAKVLEVNKEAALYFYHLLYSDKGKAGLEYFTGRGLSVETIKKFGLGYADKYRDDLYKYMKNKGYDDRVLSNSGLFSIKENDAHDLFWNRVMFPYMDSRGRVIAFGGRVLGKGEPKYYNSPETKVFQKRRNLFGLNIARSTKRPYIILSEGYMDVISLHQAGFDNVVGSMGTAFTGEQANLLKRYTDSVYICYDSDGAGQKATVGAIGIIKNAGLKVKVISLKPHKDPDEFIKAEGADAFENRILDARNGILFIADSIRNKLNLSDPDENTEFINKLVELIFTLKDDVEKESYIKTFCAEYKVSEGLIKSKLRDDESRLKKREIAEAQREERIENRNKEKVKLEPYEKYQSLLITAIIDNVSIIDAITKYVSYEDFQGEEYKKIAKLVFEQAKEGTLNSAKITDSIQDDEFKEKVISMFNANIPGDEDETVKQNAITDYVKKILEFKYENLINEESNFSKIRDLTNEKNNLSNIRIFEID